MPELPEVETTVRGLARVLEGRRITRVEARRAGFAPGLSRRTSASGSTGARVTGLGRRAKYGLIHTDRGDTMIFHLGMSGSWRIDHAKLEKHDHLLLETDDGNAAGAQRSAALRIGRSRRLRTSWTSGRRSRRLDPSRSSWIPSRPAEAAEWPHRGDQAPAAATRGSWRALAISTSARRCSARASIRSGPAVRSRWTG